MDAPESDENYERSFVPTGVEMTELDIIVHQSKTNEGIEGKVWFILITLY